VISRFVVGLVLGFAFGGLSNYFAVRVLANSNLQWHVLLFVEAALVLLPGLIVYGALRRRGLGFATGLLLGAVLAVVASWALIFWVVIGT
jgi:hypothetical protein